MTRNRFSFKFLPWFLLLLAAASGCASSGATIRTPEGPNGLAAGDTMTVISEPRFLVTAERVEDQFVFVLESLTDFTDDRGRFPNVDFAGLRVDFNNNGRIDSKVDRAYGNVGGSDALCAQWLLDDVSSTLCGALESRATYHRRFVGTRAEERPHPVYTFSVPIAELRETGPTVSVLFKIHTAGRGTWIHGNLGPRVHDGLKDFTLAQQIPIAKSRW